MLKVIVAVSRNFKDYQLLESELVKFLRLMKPNEVEIVSGTFGDADRLGERFVKEKGCALKQFPDDWNISGNSAEYRQNEDMAKYADACVVFWDCKCSGTKHMIDLAEKEGLDLKIVKY